MDNSVEPTGTRWIDTGSGPGYVVPATRDGRPEYSPAALVLAVQRLLGDRGVRVEPKPGMMPVATIAAADLLRALGVNPANAPEVKP